VRARYGCEILGHGGGFVTGMGCFHGILQTGRTRHRVRSPRPMSFKIWSPSDPGNAVKR
jgi:hypothetical protein